MSRLESARSVRESMGRLESARSVCYWFTS